MAELSSLNLAGGKDDKIALGPRGSPAAHSAAARSSAC